MRKFLILGLTMLLTCVVFGQKIPPANWGHTVNKSEVNVGDVIEVTFKTIVPKGYHIYSNDYGDCPPKKSVFTYEKNSSYELVGGANPIGSHHYEDEIFECEVADFEGKAEFRQKIKIRSNNPKIVGLLEYQMCTDDGSCVLFEYEIEVTGFTMGESTALVPVAEAPPKQDPVKVKETNNEDKADKIEEEVVTLNEGAQDSSPTHIVTLSTGNTTGFTNYAGLVPAAAVNYSSYKALSANDTSSCELKIFGGQEGEETQSFWGLFFVAFLSGLAALLTPCVFPMIPMTVSYFMKDGSKSKAIRNGVIYGLSIIGIYVLIGTLVAVIAGPAAANWLSTHWLPNIFFFLVFVIFAASFFGAFEIVLPSWLVNKADAQADKGGLTGIFFMAFTIVLVSFSCTGPIVGSILVESAGGAFVKPMLGMLGFSLAFAIPFALFAIFPSWLNGLPKSGGWLNSVKVVLGFLELAFGLKFLSVADQTYHWGLLDREIYIGLWLVIFFLMGLYLLGKLKFSHDSEIPYLSVPRLLLAIFTFAFVSYLVPGLFGAPLKALAGYMPPMSTHDFNLMDGGKDSHSSDYFAGVKPKYEEKLHLPHGLRGYYDYEQGMEVARQTGRPVFLDFTGHGCVNCREMEAVVWSDERVRTMLDKNYIVISLYVDDKTIELAENEQFYKKNSTRKIINLAKKNSWIQECYFNANAQPQYALLDNKGALLQPTRTYNKDKEAYVAFLKAGITEHKSRMDAILAAK
ncbi:MAG: thioredoxin family protein [Bacteroidia bacterium]|jgi:thiol:disulfide interchange protein|nr:thioredoxin family protein [Bacteroidia bacterium]